jgi:hypothetical protein
MGYSGDRRHARGDPGGEDRFVKVQQTIRRDLLAQLQIDAVQIEHAPVVAQRFVKLLFAGDLFGDIKLPANLLLRIKQGDEWPRAAAFTAKARPAGPAPTTARRFGPTAGVTGIRFRGRRAG